jgi:putative lipoprotein
MSMASLPILMGLAGAIVASNLAVAAEAPVGRWRATEIAGVASAEGVETTLEIRADGHIAGAGGCNGYGGKATFGPGTIVFGPLISTRMACPGPGMDQQARFERALEATSAWRRADGALTFHDRAGAVVVRFAPMR